MAEALSCLAGGWQHLSQTAGSMYYQPANHPIMQLHAGAAEGTDVRRAQEKCSRCPWIPAVKVTLCLGSQTNRGSGILCKRGWFSCPSAKSARRMPLAHIIATVQSPSIPASRARITMCVHTVKRSSSAPISMLAKHSTSLQSCALDECLEITMAYGQIGWLCLIVCIGNFTQAGVL